MFFCIFCGRVHLIKSNQTKFSEPPHLHLTLLRSCLHREKRNKTFPYLPERMEQRNVQHKHHITRLNAVGGGANEDVNGGNGGDGGGSPGGLGMKIPSANSFSSSFSVKQRAATAAAEATEARAIAAVKAAEERVAAQRAKADRAHKHRLRMAVPDTVKAEARAWERRQSASGSPASRRLTGVGRR